MKKNRFYGLGVPISTRKKFFLRMKMLALFMVMLSYGVSAMSYGQENRVTLSMRDVSLKKVLLELKKQTAVRFFYSMDKIKDIQHLSVDAREKELGELLEALLSDTDLSFTYVDNIIVIKDRVKEADKPVDQVASMAVEGRVKDAKGNALPGVTILVKGTTLGVVTDAGGNFKLTLSESENVTLVFSFVGMKTREIVYKQQPFLEVVLEEDVAEMEEVVVNGIFERKKESFTGSATVIRKEELMRSGSQNLLQNLKNIDPSFRIVENLEYGSDPNRMPEIQMRGEQGIPDIKGSYNGNPNQPLFILDGFEAAIETVFDLDMNRVETVVLLKDAAAKAIYGSRAANGVVVIETRKPEPGKLKVSYKGDLNLTVPDLTGYNLCNAWEKYMVEKEHDVYGQEKGHPEFAFFREQYLNNILEAVNRGVDTYWLSQPLKTGVGHRHSVYLEGGDERIRYGVDLLYNDVRGVMKESDRKTFTGGFTLSYRYKSLLFRNQFNVTLNRADDSPYGSFAEYTRLNPYWTPYDENGDLKQVLGKTGGGGIVEETIGNPLWNAQINTKNFSKYTELINNFYLEWNILEQLKVVGRLGLSKKQNVREDFYPASHTKFADYKADKFFEKGSYEKNNGESSSVRTDLQLNYSLLAGRHSFFANAAFNMQQNSSEQTGFKAEGFPNDRMDFIAFAKQFPANGRPAGSESISREIGFLAAFNYSWDDRYLADFSWRATASSMFGKDKRWGQFWSAGIGWNLHQEHFLSDAEWLRQLKLRASTGYTGSQNFNSYQALATFTYYQAQAYDNWVGSYLLGLPNDELKWQKTREYNVGMDLNLWSRFSARLDYYVQNTEDQLLDFTIPPSMGFTSYKENLGSTQNKGIELKLNARIWSDVAKDRYMNLFFSIAKNENKIKKISNALKSYNDSQDEELSSGDSNKPVLHYVEGQSVNAIWAVRSLGIDPASGEEMWLTKDGEITSEWRAEDQVVCGDAMPKCTGTFGLNLDYKGIFLNMTFYYQFGGQIYNQTLVDRVENADISMNVDRRIYDAVWKNPDDRVAFSFNPYGNTQPTSRFVQDLNELRLSTFNIGYDFRHCAFLSRIGLERLKASFYMNDVFRASTVKIERGLEYPFARTYSFSLQVTL